MTVLYILLVVLALLLLVVLFDSTRFVIKEYTIESSKIKKDTTFLFISDIHCKEYGKDNLKLFKAIDKAGADFAIVGGDTMIARKGKSQEKGIKFVNNLASRMNVYHSLGNHEFRAKIHKERYNDIYSEFVMGISQNNVTLLDDESAYVDNCRFIGFSMDEPFYIRGIKPDMDKNDVYKHTGDMDKNLFNVLLAHDPEYFDTYSHTEADLVLSGHFHGGIARLPFVGGVISPRLRLFPKYSGGFFEKNDTKMIVSCGLGMHSLPFRFLNPAELIIIHLKSNVQ